MVFPDPSSRLKGIFTFENQGNAGLRQDFLFSIRWPRSVAYFADAIILAGTGVFILFGLTKVMFMPKTSDTTAPSLHPTS